MPPKIAIIGGGSYNWAPTIINDVLLTEGLRGSHIVLEDIQSEPLETVRKLGEKMIADKESDCALSSTTDEAEALDGADFVAESFTDLSPVVGGVADPQTGRFQDDDQVLVADRGGIVGDGRGLGRGRDELGTAVDDGEAAVDVVEHHEGGRLEAFVDDGVLDEQAVLAEPRRHFAGEHEVGAEEAGLAH